MFSAFRHALPLSVGEFAEAREFALVAARGERLFCSPFSVELGQFKWVLFRGASLFV